MMHPAPQRCAAVRGSRRRGLSRAGGAFTLIEAIIATIVLGTAMPPMLVGVRDASARRTDAIMASRARWLASERIEDALADRHSAARGYAWVLTSAYPAEPSVAGFASFARSTTVTETGAALSGGGTGYKTVTCTVSWRDGRGTARSLSLSVVVTSYTP